MIRARFERTTPEIYRAELDSNVHSASLTDASVDALGSYRIFKLGDTKILYSLSPDGEICGIVNNGSHKGGALPSVIPHALANGGKWLNCWSVNLALPDLYNRFRFKEYKRELFDAEAYGPPSRKLLKSWRISGWSGPDYPYVSYMRYEGSEEQRLLDSLTWTNDELKDILRLFNFPYLQDGENLRLSHEVLKSLLEIHRSRNEEF